MQRQGVPFKFYLVSVQETEISDQKVENKSYH